MNVLSNPLADVGIAASLALPFLAPEIGAGLGLGAATDVAAAGSDASLAAAGGAAGGFDLGTIGPGLAGGTVDIGTPVLSDAAITSDLASPGASAFASTQDAFSGGGTAFDMGGGGTLDPAAAAAGGAPAPGIGGTAAPAAPSFAQDLTQGDLLAGTGVAGNTAGTGFGAAPAAQPGILSTIGGALKTAAPFVGAAGVAGSLYSGYEQNKALNALNQQEKANAQAEANIANAATTAAQPILTSGTALQQYIQTGTLPQAFQTQLDQAVAAAKAQRIQAAATMGQSTDPLQNTALGQDLAAIDMQAQTQKANIEQTLQQAGASMVAQANQLLSTGVGATEISAQLPLMVQNLDIKLAQLTSSSIASFAAAMNGGARIGGQGTGATININSSTGAVT